jgi:hypothetical protein
MTKIQNYPLTDRFSLARAVDALEQGYPRLNPEAEQYIRIKQEFGRLATTVGDARIRVAYVPFSEFGPGRRSEEQVTHTRDLGGSLFQTITAITPSFTTGLIAHSQVFKAGATLLEGCEGQVMLAGTTAIPQPAFSTNTDGTAVTIQSDPVFVGGSVGANPMIFSPLRLSFKTKISNQLLKQAARIFEPVLRDVISRGISSMLDNLALYGTGTNGQPLGVYSASTPVAITGSIAWADYKAALLGVMQTDLDPDSFGLITSPSMQNVLDSEFWVSGGVDSFWEKIANRFPDRMFVGNEINASSPGGAHAIFLGLWRFLFLILWGTGLEVVFDPYSSLDTFETVVRVNILANVGITFPAAFKALTQTV